MSTENKAQKISTFPKRYVKGVGMTKFSLDLTSTFNLAHEAIIEALIDADMKITDIEAVMLSTEDTKVTDERQRHLPTLLTSIMKRNIPILQVPAVCGGGGAAFWAATRLKYNNVLALAVDKIATSTTPIITKEIMNAGDSYWEQDEGLVFPAINALVAQEHFSKYGTTHEDLELIAFKNHHNASLNPKARFYKQKISLENIKKSPMVSTPLTLHDCSVSVNGAAAAIISNDKTDVELKASSLMVDYLAPFEREDITTWRAGLMAGKEAFTQAGITPSDINVAELHDAFTIVELIAYEDLGFCKKGDGGKLIQSGKVNLDGKMPINTSGGLKARGHPISPTGMAQVVEIVNQLRGKCGERQVKNTKYGLTHNIGGAGGTTTVHILKKI